MARCGCASDTCSCSVTGGAGISVTGNGSPTSPFVISTTAPGNTLSVTDTTTVDLTLSGNGSAANPWVLSAVTVGITGLLTITDTSTLDLTLLGSGTAASPYALSGVAKVASGTAFPGSPVDGQQFYRTDEDALYIYDGTQWEGPTKDSGWQTPTLLNSWVNYDPGGAWQSARYRKVNGIVYIEGLVKNGTSQTVLTLPVGYRPANSLMFSTFSNQTTNTRLDVLANGNIDLVGANNGFASIATSYFVGY